MQTKTSREQEHDAWRAVCRNLEQCGAVTVADLASPTSAKDTDGQRLLATIREWGDALAALRVALS